MARFTGYEACPRCRKRGRDRRGDNLATYDDGGAHCFSCGHHVHPKHYVRKEEKPDGAENKAVLPPDFTREVPAAGWKWLLQYGLPYTYWRPYTGYSPRDERLVITFGEPIRFSIGRYLGNDAGEKGRDGRWVQRPPRKWFFYGDGHSYVSTIGGLHSGPIVLVEDIISAHKVGQVAPSLCLFGTHIHDLAIKHLIAEKRPVVIWLDEDQRGLMPQKVNRLQTFLRYPVRTVTTEKDPKEHSLSEIKEIIT